MSTRVSNKEFTKMLEKSEGRLVAIDGAQPVVGKVSFTDADDVWVNIGGRYAEPVPVEPANVIAIWNGKRKPKTFDALDENWFMRWVEETEKKQPKNKDRIAKLEAQVAALQLELADLRAALIK